MAAAVRARDPERRARLDALAWELVSTLRRLRPDLDAAVHRELFGPALVLGLVGADGASSTTYEVEALLDRADGAPSRAVELVLRAQGPDH